MNMKFIKLLYVLTFALCTTLASSQIVYIKSNGTGDGSSWANAAGDVQSVLDTISSGSQIWLAEGVYYPIICNPCTEAQRNVSFSIPNGVAVYGGFDGTEVSLELRDWEFHITILSGNINQDNDEFNNAQTIVYFSNVNSTTILDGCVLENGYAYSPDFSSGEKNNSGAAIYNSGVLDGNASHPTIRNCTFRNNEATAYGGAVYNNGGFDGNANPVFENCIFLNNVSQAAGGAVYNQGSFAGNASCNFSNCTFSNNNAVTTGGGAVFNQGAEDGITNTLFLNCSFEDNQSLVGHGGAVHSHGRDGTSNTTFNNCLFRNNIAQFGGAVSNNGTSGGEANPTFTNCIFEENHAGGDGGSIYNWGSEGQSNAYFLNSTFEKNNSTFAGAGMFNNGIDGECNATIINCKFIENVADTYGGAVYNNGKRGFADATIINSLFLNNAGNSAGGIYNLGGEGGHSNAQVTNCTFYGNTANVGAAIYNNANDSTGTSNPTVTNCIFWKNEANFGNVFRNISASPLIQFSVVDLSDCESLNSGLGSEVICGQAVLFNTYPEFVDTSIYNLRLEANSPILDLGNNTVLANIDFDLDNEDRIKNGTVDFGAYEFTPPLIPTTIITQPQSQVLCTGDSLVLSVEVEGTAPFMYQWHKDGEPISSATDSVYIIPQTSVETAGAYICFIYSLVDSINTSIATISLEPLLTPQIEIQASALEICEGDIVSFSSEFINEGNDPVYNWYLNGAPVSEHAISLELENLNDEDWIFAALESSENCVDANVVFSDTIQINVNPLLEASISIIGPDSIVCLGNQARFEADFSSGGLNPTFQWSINDVEVFNSNTEIFTTNELQVGDQIACQMVSSEACLFENPVVSENINIALDSCNLISSLERIDNRFISIQPNPSKGWCTLEVNNLDGPYTLQVVDLMGRIIEQKEFQINNDYCNIPITLSNSGIYVVKFYNERHFYSQKIIVQK